MGDCIFCKISNDTLGTEFLYEDDTAVAFDDIHPKSKTHILIVPKKHINTIMDMEDGDENIVGHLVKISKFLAEKYSLPGYKLQFNVGESGGQEVFHIHLHMLSNSSK